MVDCYVLYYVYLMWCVYDWKLFLYEFVVGWVVLNGCEMGFGEFVEWGEYVNLMMYYFVVVGSMDCEVCCWRIGDEV